MDSNPLVSICIPVFNGGDYIAHAIESALNQSYSNIEVIVIDNASTDHTPDIIEQLCSTHPRRIVSFRNQKTVSMVDNFNIALSRANGEYLKLLPHDDILTVDSIGDLIRGANPGDHFIVGLRDFIFEGTGIRNRIFYLMQNIIWRVDKILGEGFTPPKEYLDAFSQNTSHNFIGEPGAVLISSVAFRTVGGFDRRFHQLCDLQLWHRLGTRFGLTVVPIKVASFRVHNASESASRHTSRDRLLSEYLGISTLLLNCMGDHPSNDVVCNYLLDKAQLSQDYQSRICQPKLTVTQSVFLSKAINIISKIPFKRAYQIFAIQMLVLILSKFSKDTFSISFDTKPLD
ncbi:glycosyltransferase family 2 protein [Parahaliea maris]|uniref:Glycosyltransferase family 2 protein n=1 Tax=Parahaliea maris TaxID=2716870 RepID=A0A5C9AAL7_9GAMM|nr:glycosyltransferase family 2 protein [Parahaliea maris]TXS96690.1 glycosyltransferase family 2 protein [Parahaliea maris]